MISHSLNGAWEFHQLGDSEWLPAEVPGGAHTDLLRLGGIPDPFIRDNELKVQWVAEADWEYRRTFLPEPELLAHEKIFLYCGGLDTLAEVYLNREFLGRGENMFRPYEWELTGRLYSGENEICIRFRSPVGYIRERQARFPLPSLSPSIHLQGSPYVRKAPSHFGWDWGPKLPPIGIWREICLVGYSHARLADVHLRQEHAGDRVTLTVRAALQRWGAMGVTLVARLTSPDGVSHTVESALDSTGQILALHLPILNPQLWWPNGYGGQPLYRLEVELQGAGSILDRREFQVGLRTLELRQEPDDRGRSFTFVVNGVPIFAKGANWIPADSFPTRVNPERLENQLHSAALTNMNMLRVWGGGYYEDEKFYDLCDRYGLLVWQDFMFACSVYPLDDPVFLENVADEVRYNVRRLRHRACLALWCGNNEMEWMWRGWKYLRQLNPLKAAFERFFYRTLPAWVAAEDPDHPYWPSSPSSNKPFKAPNSPAQGNMHYWAVWHGRRPFSAYRSQFPRFMTEFGFQSLPPLETLRVFAGPEDWSLDSRILRHRQRSWGGNSLIFAQMKRHFRQPKNFEALVYISMILQAEGIRTGVEHWRRNCQRVSGTLYWQLNDCWPAISWSSLDYSGRWKALHYAARRFYTPVLLSLVEGRQGVGIHITNDRSDPFEGTVHWALQQLDGQNLQSGEQAAMVEPRASREILFVPTRLSLDQRRETVLVCELVEAGERLALVVTTPVPNKWMNLRDPQIQVEIRVFGEELELLVTGGSLARFVELSLDEAQVIFSDNYFDLPAGYTRRVTCQLPEGWTLERAKAALHVRSLYDSYLQR